MPAHECTDCQHPTQAEIEEKLELRKLNSEGARLRIEKHIIAIIALGETVPHWYSSTLAAEDFMQQIERGIRETDKQWILVLNCFVDRMTNWHEKITVVLRLHEGSPISRRIIFTNNHEVNK